MKSMPKHVYIVAKDYCKISGQNTFLSSQKTYYVRSIKHPTSLSGTHGVLHAQRVADTTNAVTTVMQDLPATELPYNGDVKLAAQEVLPVLEDLFKMPDMGPPRGSKQWIRLSKTNIQDAEFSDIAKYEALMVAFIKYQERIGDQEGRVRVLPGETVPTGTYKKLKLVNRGPVHKPRSLSGHGKLRYVLLKYRVRTRFHRLKRRSLKCLSKYVFIVSKDVLLNACQNTFSSSQKTFCCKI